MDSIYNAIWGPETESPESNPPQDQQGDHENVTKNEQGKSGDNHTLSMDESSTLGTPISFQTKNEFEEDFVLIETNDNSNFFNDAALMKEHFNLVKSILNHLTIEQAWTLRSINTFWRDQLSPATLFALFDFQSIFPNSPTRLTLCADPTTTEFDQVYTIGVHGTKEMIQDCLKMSMLDNDQIQRVLEHLQDQDCCSAQPIPLVLCRQQKSGQIVLSRVNIVAMTHGKLCEHELKRWATFQAHILVMDLRSPQGASSSVKHATRRAKNIRKRDEGKGFQTHISFFGIGDPEAQQNMAASVDLDESTEWDIIESIQLDSDVEDLDASSSSSNPSSSSSSSAAHESAEKVFNDGQNLDNQKNWAMCLEAILNSLDPLLGFDLISNKAKSAQQGSTMGDKVTGFGTAIAGGATILATETAVYVPAYFFTGVLGGAVSGSQIVDNSTYNRYGSIAVIPQVAGGVTGAVLGGIGGVVTGVCASISSGAYDVITYATNGKLQSNEADDTEVVPYREFAHDLLEVIGFEIDGKE